MSSYTVNQIPNPSFENTNGTTGYTAVSGAVLTTEYTDSLYGSNSMRVTTNAAQSGQGFYSPYVSEPHPLVTNVYSGSLYLKGTDHIQVNVMLARNPGGVIILSKTVTLTEDWQRVTLPNGATPPGVDNVYLLVQTLSATATTFLVDGVQIEQNTVVTEYCDGDQYGCYWTGDPNNSASVREVRFAIESEGFGQSGGNLTFIVPGEVFQMEAFGDNDISGGTAELSEISRVAAFDDFAIFPLTDKFGGTGQDPAMTYYKQNNGGTLAGEYGQAFARQFGLFMPPLDYPVSGGLAWKRAQYAAVGFRFDNLQAGSWNYLDAVQFEPNKVGIDSGPSDYETPRQIKTIVKPDRLNYIKNPSFETSFNFWGLSGDATSVRDNSSVVPMYGAWTEKVNVNSGYTETGAVATAAGTASTNDYLVTADSDASDINVGDLCKVEDSSGALKENAVFHVTKKESAFGFTNISFNPEAASPTVAGDKIKVIHYTAANPGIYTDVDNLIVGRTYTASAYVQGSNSISDIVLSAGGSSTSASGSLIPYGGVIVDPDNLDDPDNIGYGEGPYGGAFPPGSGSNNFPANTWIRMYCTFVATDTTHRLQFIASTTLDATYPASFWVDAVLVEEGEILQPYFDGSFGPDYLWESGGTPSEARSYYYEGRRAKVYIIDEIVEENTPLGISAAEPQYAVPPTQ